MSSSELTMLQAKVLEHCVKAGAVTTRSVIAQWGPKPNWSKLIDHKFLRAVDTIYGEVIGIGEVSRARVSEFPKELQNLPYLVSASALADRAYQQDAFTALQQEGYTIYEHHYKRASLNRHRGSGHSSTAQIISTCLRVSKIEAELMELRWRQRVRHPKEIVGVERDMLRLGYPHLYATISGGGPSKQRVEALYRQAKEWSGDWRSPLLIVVPDLNQHRDVLRRVAAEQEDNRRSDRTSTPRTHFGSYAVLRLIEQPLPRRVTRPSQSDTCVSGDSSGTADPGTRS